MLKTVASFTLLLALFGCASHSGVVQMGKDTYLIAKQQATGFPGLGNIKAEIIAEGSAYCRGINKEFQIVSVNETKPPYILGNYPRSEITFMCITADDPEHLRPKLQKTPDAVIQIQTR